MIVLDACALVDVVLDQPTAGWVLDEIAGEKVGRTRTSGRRGPLRPGSSGAHRPALDGTGGSPAQL